MCAYAITASSPASSPAGHELASLSVLASSTSPSPTYKRPPSPHELVRPSLPFLLPTTHFVQHLVGVLQLLPGSTTAAELRHSAVPRAIIVTSPSYEAPPVEVTVDMPSGGLSLRFFWKNGTLMRHRCSRPHQFGLKPFPKLGHDVAVPQRSPLLRLAPPPPVEGRLSSSAHPLAAAVPPRPVPVAPSRALIDHDDNRKIKKP
uniref:Uncharacterized protein n=1 Tax=Oryza rufipogon TaxID=4529 RepID=A0A0E0MYB9_ORYRU